MGKIRIIQIGVGNWGFSWIGKILSLEQNENNVELVGIIDIDEKTIKKTSSYYDLDESFFFSSIKEAVKYVEADAALILVPPNLHKDIAIEALENGLHCLIEKPLAGNMEDALEIVNKAESLNKKIMVSQNYRFKRAPQTVKNVVNKNLIGDIGSVFINFQKNPKFTGFRTEMEEPLINDMSIHHFDQIRCILGDNPKKISATSWNTKWSWFKGNPTTSVVFEMESGAFVSYVGNWISSGWETTWDGEWRIQGKDGEIHWSNNRVILSPENIFTSVFQEKALESDGKLVFDLISMKYEERMATLMEFASAIIENREPESSGKDNLHSLGMVLGATYSAKYGDVITVKDLFDYKYFSKYYNKN